MRTMRANEQDVLKRRCGIGYKPQDLRLIATALGKTKNQIRAIEAKGLTKLFDAKYSDALPELHGK